MPLNPDKPLREYSGKELALLILSMVAIGSLVVLLPLAPGLGMVLRAFKTLDRRERARLKRKLQLMEKNGYFTSSGGRLRISSKGKRLLTEDEVWNTAQKMPKRWDGKWHLVMFDIPYKKERGRQALRARLNDLGYIKYQNSVFVHKYDMRDAIEKFSSFYFIRSFVRFATVIDIDNDNRVTNHFREWQKTH